MAFKYTGKTPDTFFEAVQKYGLLPTCRTRARDIFLLMRHTYLVKVWKMDIHPYTLISLKATLDRTYPKGVHIGEGTAINFGAVILTHDMARRKYADTRIGKNCLIGAHSLVLAGVTVHDGSVVAAGAVVTKDVASGTIVAGNPAKVIKTGVETMTFGRLKPENDPEVAAGTDVPN